MPKFTLKEISKIGHVVNTPADWFAGGVSTDSRTAKSSDIFFALKGEHFDGHEFVKNVTAGLRVVDKSWYERQLDKNLSVVVVDDTLQALQLFAKNHRRKKEASVIGITGTSGKTTTKEMIHRILATTYDVLATEGNLNNEIGVPLTLLRIEEDTMMAIVEMGADRPGDIARLCEIASPNSGVITNIGEGHLEKLGSIEEVARTKSALFKTLEEDGVRYINLDDSYLKSFSEKKKGAVTFAVNADAHYKAKLLGTNELGCVAMSVDLPGDGNLQVQLAVPGVHQIYNAIAAIAVGHSMGVASEAIREALESCTTTGGRMRIFGAKGLTILDDTYNANPDSTRSAIDTLAQMNVKSRKIVVLGDMLELGNASEAAHHQIGLHVKNKNMNAGFFYGQAMRVAYQGAQGMGNTFHFEDKNSLKSAVKDFVKDGDALLIKGSRGMKMEDLVEELS